MGHRVYLAKVTTKEYNEIKDFNSEQFKEYFDEDRVSPFEIATEIFNFGVNYELMESEHLNMFFTNDEVHTDMNEDYNFMLANKDFLRYAIESYTKKIQTYYKSLLENISYGSVRKMNTVKKKEWFGHIYGMANEWGLGISKELPYVLDDGEESITTSWKFEYEVFELVRLYKSFDWENDTLVFYGY